MRIVRGVISSKFSKSDFICSCSNEESTDGDIAEMGLNLAKEVKNHLQNPEVSRSIGRISFIGYSLGGVIIRAALPHLNEYSSRFYSFVSFSSPHLGYLLSSSSLVDAGIWVMKKWLGCKSLKQLSFKDEKDFEKCFLYNLSKQEGLGWFHNIIFAGSMEDEYVPFESARLQKIREGGNSRYLFIH
jgi:hypothetical protein